MYPAVHYNNRFFLFAATFFAAVFIVLFTEGVNFFEAWTYPSFYPAVGCSMVIAGILIAYIHWITTWLDGGYRWEVQLLQRAVYQFFLGFANPALMAFGLAALYYYLFSYNIMDTEYLKVDYPVIVMLLLMLNMYYIIHYHIILIQGKSRQQVNEEPLPYEFETDEDRDIQIKDHLHSQTVEVIDCDALYYFRKNKNYWMCGKNGDIRLATFSLVKVKATCPVDYYFKINRQVIIRFDTFENFQTGDKKSTLKLVGLNPFCLNKQMKIKPEFFSVTEDRVLLFKAWFNRLHPEKQDNHPDSTF